jgi:Spy/CpxP family protein refolding chaperone
MKKSRLWIVLSLILVFTAGLAAGVFAERLWFGKHPGGRPSGRDHVPSHDRWAKDLGLTEDQQAKIQEIFKKNEARMDELRVDYFKHLGVIRDELRKEIDPILTPEQRQKQDEMIKQARERYRREMDRRPSSKPRSQNNPQGKPPKERSDEKENHSWSGDYRDRRGSHPGLFPD